MMMNKISIAVFALSLILSQSVSSVAGLVSWADAGTGDWETGGNWVGGNAPVSGVDSVQLGGTTNDIRLSSEFTVASGQSLNSSGSGNHPELILQSGSSLTLATGGSIDIAFMRPRFSSGGQFTIESGATLHTDNYGLGFISGTVNFVADAAGVTTWNNSTNFQSGADNLIVDLSNYDFSNGDTLTLVNYGGSTSGQTFASVSVVGAEFVSIDYGDGSNDAITLTAAAVPEPSGLALVSVGVWLIIGRRRRRKLPRA